MEYNSECVCLKEEYAARVAQDLRRLPSLLRQHHRLPSQNTSLHLETDLVQLDSAHLLNATDPGPRLCWTHCPRRHPDLRDRKREGPSLVVAGPTPKLPRLNLQTLSSVLGAEGNVFFEVTAPCTSALTAAIVDIIKHKHSQKRADFLLHTTRVARPHMATNCS